MRRAMAQQRQRQGRDEPRSKECSGRHQGNLWSWGVAFFYFLSFFLVSSLGLGEGNGLGGNSVFSIALSRSPFLLFCVFLYFGGYVFPVGLLAPPCNKRMALLLLTQSSLSRSGLCHAISFSLLGFPVCQWIQLIIAAKPGGAGESHRVFRAGVPHAATGTAPSSLRSIFQTLFWGAAKHKITDYISPSFLSTTRLGMVMTRVG